MSLGEIFSDAIKYPFSDITKFLLVGVIALLAGLSSIVTLFQVDSTAILLLASIIGFIFAILLLGYGVGVIKNGIQHSDEIPDIDFVANLVTGVKAFIIEIVYFLIPFVIMIILMLLTGTIGASLDHVAAGLGIGLIIAIILFIVFAILETVAIARFADTDDMGAALNIGEVIDEVKKIGIVKLLGFVIVAILVIILAFIVAGMLGFIPYVGLIIGTLLAGGFVTLFYNRALGLLYSKV